MATTMDPNDRAVVNYDEPPVKPPPILAVGPLAWMRENLFKSAFDTIVTIVSAIVIVSAVIGLMEWVIGGANWFVVTTNLRLFLAGTFPLDQMWRLEWVVRFAAFVVGFTLLAYVRVSRALVTVIAILLLLLFVVPVIVSATAAPVTSYLAAGSTPIVSGTITELPQENLAFVAKAGETVTVRVANAGSDNALTDAAGFTDRASAALINAAANRLELQQEQVNAQDRLDHALLTDAQRTALTDEIAKTTVPPALTETYNINTTPVQVALIDGTTGATLDSATLTADSPLFSVTLPEDGWYVLQKSVVGSDQTALLATTGVYPLTVRNTTRNSTQIEQYERMVDGFTVDHARPEIDGDQVPMMQITDNQYQGMRPAGDYMRLFVAPFFNDLSFPLLQLVLAGVIGYYVAFGLARVLPATPNASQPGLRVRGMVTWLWLLWLIALFLLAYGIQGLSALGAGLLLSRFVWVGWMYFSGMNLDQTWGRPLLALVTVLGVVQSVIAEGLFDKLSQGVGSAIIPLISVVIWLVIGLYAARRGRGARSSWSSSLRLRALIGAAVLWLILFIAPPLLIQAANASTENVLPLTETRLWGGFLLTAVLTIVALLASFPLGVLLALGRRSSLPVVRGTCIVYIELVRGVPLITVLFMAQLLVPLVNPALVNVDNVFRAMVGMTLFSAAYLAENVRGGLQSIPGGQEEAAKALGLSGWQVTLLITLPQALRAVIPALVGQAIALFKDTSLVSLVGLVDLLGQSNSVIAQPEYIGLRSEAYVFIGIIYFIFSYLMAWVSRRIEASGSGAARRV